MFNITVCDGNGHGFETLTYFGTKHQNADDDEADEVATLSMHRTTTDDRPAVFAADRPASHCSLRRLEAGTSRHQTAEKCQHKHGLIYNFPLGGAIFFHNTTPSSRILSFSQQLFNLHISIAVALYNYITMIL